MDDRTRSGAPGQILTPLRPRSSPTTSPSRRRRWPLVVGLGLLLVLLLGGLAGLRARAALAAYRDVRAGVAALEALQATDLTSLDEDDLLRIEAQLTQLREDLDRLDAAVTPPVGAALAERLPGIGPRYAAGRRLIRTADTLASAGATASALGRETLAAFQSTGLRRSDTDPGPTWLDVLGNRQAELQDIIAQIEEARRLRASIDDAALPAAARARMPALDHALEALDLSRVVDHHLPLLGAALGAEQPARYLVLFQNSAELRLSGGFPGTVALVTFERGQLQTYEFHDVYELQRAYEAGRAEPVAPPWPIAHYFRHEEWPIQDASWEADFAAAGAQVVAMYRATGWPAIDGVVAVTPAVISDILVLTGPVTVEVDGEPLRIDADNVHEEIERQRYLHRGESDIPSHKAVLAQVGRALVERLTTADRALLLDLIRTLRAAADGRDLQIYAVDSRLQAEVDARRWSGRLRPDPDTPTLALTAASVVTTKASQAVHPRATLTIAPPADGQRLVTLAVDFTHTGDPDADPYYAGFQRWWVEVELPEGSRRLDASREPMPDPAAPNGGSYEVEIFPGQTTHLTVRFTMPDTDRLLLRRQPGITPLAVVAEAPDCPAPLTATLTADLTLDLTALCH